MTEWFLKHTDCATRLGHQKVESASFVRRHPHLDTPYVHLLDRFHVSWKVQSFVQVDLWGVVSSQDTSYQLMTADSAGMLIAYIMFNLGLLDVSQRDVSP